MSIGQGRRYGRRFGIRAGRYPRSAGAVSIELVVKQDNSDHILVYEIWETKEDHQAYMGWRQERGDLDALGGIVAEAPTVKYYDIADPA